MTTAMVKEALERRNELESRMLRAQTKGAEACREYGECLREIKADRLWADDFESWADYLSIVWDLTEVTADKWITAFGTCENLKELGHCIDHLTIANAIALDKIGDKEMQGLVWSELMRAKVTPTAEAVEAVAAKHLPAWKNIGHLTADEEREFVRTAETDMDQALEFARFAKWTPRLDKLGRFVNRIYRDLETGFRDRDPVLAKYMDTMAQTAERIRERLKVKRAPAFEETGE